MEYHVRAKPAAAAWQAVPAAPASDASAESTPYPAKPADATSPVVSGPSSVVYTIIPESPQPHHTLSTAQVLPDLPYFGVVGSTGSDEVVDLYRMHLNGGATGFEFRLAAQVPDLTGGIQLFVLDGSGQVLARSSAGGQSDPTIQLTLGDLPAGTTLYLGISAGAAGSQGGGSINYQLWVDRQPAPSRPGDVPFANSSLVPLAVSALLASPLTVMAATGLPPGRDGDSVSTSPGPQAISTVATNLPVGSLVVRPAGLSAGSLSEGDSAIGMLADPRAQSTLAQLRTAAADSTRPDQVEGTSRTKDHADLAPATDAVALIRGPGGFPLLGATPLGHGTQRSLLTRDVPLAARPAEELNQGQAESIECAESLAAISAVSAEGESADQAHLLRVRGWDRLPVSLFSGLGIATVLTLNALLSQPMAGFDYLSARFDVGGAGGALGRIAAQARRASRTPRPSRSGRTLRRPQ
jgi:hypothetical protein